MDILIKFIERYFTIRSHARKVIKSLARIPETGEWENAEGTCVKHKTGMQLRLGLNWWDVDMYPRQNAFNLYEKWEIKRTIKVLNKASRIKKLANATSKLEDNNE